MAAVLDCIAFLGSCRAEPRDLRRQKKEMSLRIVVSPDYGPSLHSLGSVGAAS